MLWEEQWWDWFDEAVEAMFTAIEALLSKHQAFHKYLKEQHAG